MLAPHRSITPRSPREKALLGLLDRLWERYRGRVAHARVYETLVERGGGTFRNDHIAFRTIAWQAPAAGTFSVTRLFEALGYRARACYEFPEKKLSSVHLAHENPVFPKLFVSQLESWRLSLPARRALGRSLDAHRAPPPLEALAGPPAKLARLAYAELTELPWPLAQKRDVLAVDEESQFGAWVLLNGYEVNHFTASVDAHGCASLEGIDRTVAALRSAGVPMKAEIEGAPGAPLRQSATEAVTLEMAARDGRKTVRLPWTYAYFELAERPLIDGKRFEGFLGGQATNLFDMTATKPGR
jgi:hypothetical protein